MEDISAVSEPLERALTQARCVTGGGEADWSREQRRDIETLVNDVEQLRDVVNIAGCHFLSLPVMLVFCLLIWLAGSFAVQFC